jgi:hypothetical protein
MSYLERIAQRLRDAEDDLRSEVEEQERRWRFRVHKGRVRFDHEVRQAHRRLRQSIPAYLRGANLLSLLTAPVIYSLVVPFALLDLWVWAYQWVCFPIYGIARVRRRSYFVLDRHRLEYLNAIEKANCTYCTYANGVIAYVREVASRTELYWCPIRHARSIPAPHPRYHHFFDYGDAERYHRELVALRRTLRDERSRDRS